MIEFKGRDCFSISSMQCRCTDVYTRTHTFTLHVFCVSVCVQKMDVSDHRSAKVTTERQQYVRIEKCTARPLRSDSLFRNFATANLRSMYLPVFIFYFDDDVIGT